MFNGNNILFVFIFLCSFATAQTIKVNKETIQLKGEVAEGYEVQLDGTVKEVESELLKYVKPIGKAKKTTEGYSISLPIINGKNYTSPLLMVVRDKGSGAAWLGIKTSEWGQNAGEASKDIEKLVYDFGVSFNRYKIQQQIDESNRALHAVERQQQRLVNQNKDFGARLETNKSDKIKLEKSLENNKLEFDALNKRLEKNKKDQDSVAFVGEQIKKVIGMQKDKQKNVN
jgi:hypothetical protein